MESIISSARTTEKMQNIIEIYTSWCKIGKPKNHNLYKQLKAEKRNLRRQQRMEHAIRQNQPIPEDHGKSEHSTFLQTDKQK